MTFLGHEIKPLTVEEYMARWRAKNALPMKGLDKVERRMRHYSRYNIERQESVEARWKPSAEFLAAVEALRGPQTWLFLTDDWCIDSAYSLPLLEEVVRRRSDIALHVLLRDDNLGLQDEYLTDGRRSIPILAAFDSGRQPLFRWGPHPDELERIRRALQDAGAPGSDVSAATISWFEDFGELGVERELAAVFAGAGAPPASHR
jgi:hypothetical protein